MNKALYDSLTPKEQFFADQLFEIAKLLRRLTAEVEDVDIQIVK